MPSDDVILNLKQIAGYPSAPNVFSSDSVVFQRGGLGGPYMEASAATFVGTALSGGGDMSVGGQLSVASVQSGSGQFSNLSVGLLDAQKACFRQLDAAFGSIGGAPIATQDYVQALHAASVLSFMGRQGDVTLWINDILAAGGAPIFSPFFMGAPRSFTPSPVSNSTRLATTEFVHRNSGMAIDNLLATHPLVFTFNGRSGDVALTEADIEAAGATLPFAPLDSPAFTGYPTAPTAPPGSQTAQLATTAFVMAAVQESTTGVASFNGRTGIVSLTGADVANAGGALIASPSFTGSPQAPTAAPGTDTAQIATCQWVINELGGVTSGVTSFNGRAGEVVLTLADITGVGGAPLASPAFNGAPTAPTAPTNTSTQQLATTAFVMTAVTAGSVVSFNGRTGVVTLTANDLSAASGVTNPSPALLGVPTAPTATAGTSTGQIATTAFVAAALAGSGVSSFNGRVGAVTLSLADVNAAFPASTALPLVDGTASAGTATGWSRGDHVHPTDTSRYSASNPSGFQTASQVASALAAYLPLTGGALTGPLTVAGAVAAQSPNASTIAAFTFQSSTGVQEGVLRWSPSDGSIALQQAGGGYILLSAAGDFQITGNAYKPGGGSWNATSDERIKTVEGDYELGLDEVCRLRPVVYRFKGNDTLSAEGPSPHASLAAKGQRFVGMVAQEVEAVFPGMVLLSSGFIDRRPVADIRSLDANELIYALVNAVKTLAARLEALEAT